MACRARGAGRRRSRAREEGAGGRAAERPRERELEAVRGAAKGLRPGPDPGARARRSGRRRGAGAAGGAGRGGPGGARSRSRGGARALLLALSRAAQDGREGLGGRRPGRARGHGRLDARHGRRGRLQGPGRPAPRRARRAGPSRAAGPGPWRAATGLEAREGGVRARPRSGGGHALAVSRAVMAAVAVQHGRREGPGVAAGPSEAEVRPGAASSAASARRGRRGAKPVVACDRKGLGAAAGRVAGRRAPEVLRAPGRGARWPGAAPGTARRSGRCARPPPPGAERGGRPPAGGRARGCAARPARPGPGGVTDASREAPGSGPGPGAMTDASREAVPARRRSSRASPGRRARAPPRRRAMGRERKRRSDVVGLFPAAAAVRLVGAPMLEAGDGRAVARRPMALEALARAVRTHPVGLSTPAARPARAPPRTGAPTPPGGGLPGVADVGFGNGGGATGTKTGRPSAMSGGRIAPWRRDSRRHVWSCCRDSACRRATSVTLVPRSPTSIRTDSFCSSVHRRRRSTPSRTPPRIPEPRAEGDVVVHVPYDFQSRSGRQPKSGGYHPGGAAGVITPRRS